MDPKVDRSAADAARATREPRHMQNRDAKRAGFHRKTTRPPDIWGGDGRAQPTSASRHSGNSKTGTGALPRRLPAESASGAGRREPKTRARPTRAGARLAGRRGVRALVARGAVAAKAVTRTLFDRYGRGKTPVRIFRVLGFARAREVLRFYADARIVL